MKTGRQSRKPKQPIKHLKQPLLDALAARVDEWVPTVELCKQAQIPKGSLPAILQALRKDGHTIRAHRTGNWRTTVAIHIMLMSSAATTSWITADYPPIKGERRHDSARFWDRIRARLHGPDSTA